MTPDRLEELRSAVDELDHQPVHDHVHVLSDVLGALVDELDDLARTIPSGPHRA